MELRTLRAYVGDTCGAPLTLIGMFSRVPTAQPTTTRATATPSEVARGVHGSGEDKQKSGVYEDKVYRAITQRPRVAPARSVYASTPLGQEKRLCALRTVRRSVYYVRTCVEVIRAKLVEEDSSICFDSVRSLAATCEAVAPQPNKSSELHAGSE